MRHAASSAATLTTGAIDGKISQDAINVMNRIRSGSFSGDVQDGSAYNGAAHSNANPNASSFGRSWVDPSRLSQPSRPAMHSNLSHLSAESAGSGSGSIGSANSYGHSTLDYLGLGGNGGGGVETLDLETPRAADFGFQQNDLSDFSRTGNNSRHRASTVSNFARPPTSNSYSDLISAANLGLNSTPRLPVGLYDMEDQQEYLLNPSRPRATTISMLEPKIQRENRVPPPRNDNKEFASMHRPIAPRHGPSASVTSVASAAEGREHHTSGGRGEPHGQTPTRSVWLGNLDVMTTAGQLNDVFCHYGAIESLRLLPEKSCAFVNFIDRADAIRAKDDILIRLGGQIPQLSDTPVRVGFGKIDSVPTAAPSTSTLKYSMSSSSLSSLASDREDEGREHVGKQSPNGMGPDPNAQPSRALWVGSIPSHTTPGTLLSIFAPFGAVESARVLTNKQCGFVNFESIDSAIAARTALNGREILGAEVGAVKIGFARIPVKGSNANSDDAESNDGQGMLHALKDIKGTSAVSRENVANLENYGSNLVIDLINKGVLDDVKAVRPSSALADDNRSEVGTSVSHRYSASESGVSEQQMIMMVLSQGDDSVADDVVAAGQPEKPALYYSYIPVLPERQQFRRFDSLGLKEIRKRLDGQFCDQDEVDRITSDIMEDSVMLSSDYIGNTIIQKLYERASPHLRLAMLDRIAPHLALIGTHKNGTWAAQKIIECSQTPEELNLIAHNLAPYVPPLSADSYGNYLVSACLRFGLPSNAFIFDAMVDRVWDIAQTRFGARCMRTCLESPSTTPLQRKRIATAIILHSIPLATNPNGALLLTWLMDSSDLPGRYGLLASRLASYVQHLCTHKLASLTVLRLVNQKSEPQAAAVILEAIFQSPSDRVLHDILADQVHGVHTIQKIVCGGFVTDDEKPSVISATRRVLEAMKVNSAFAYKRLLEECGLPVLSGSTAGAGQRYVPRNGTGNANPNANSNVQGSVQALGMPRTSGGGSYPMNPNQQGLPQQQHQYGHRAGAGAGGFHQPQQPYYTMTGAAQDMGMAQMMSSMQAFQLGQGLANQGGLQPLMIPGGQHQHPGAYQPLSPGLPMTPTPTIGSFATPHAQLMSPNSDPFNPVSISSSLLSQLPPLLSVFQAVIRALINVRTRRN